MFYYQTLKDIKKIWKHEKFLAEKRAQRLAQLEIGESTTNTIGLPGN